jgi:hypothetical protein
MLSLSGRRTSTRWERRQLKDWACLAPSLTGEAACPSERCAALQAAHLSYDVLRISDLEVRCPQPGPAAASATSKCLCIATNAPWYVSNRQIDEDLGIPFIADHIRALTESFDSKLADAGNPFIRQLGRHLCRPRAD